jgi:serine/threonine protein kinase
MTSRRDDSEPEDLLTSQDLFGDLIDAPLEAVEKPAAAVRNAPIRVQVSEPGLPRKDVATPTGEPQVLPEDMAVLLEAFADPSETATPAASGAPASVSAPQPAEPAPDPLPPAPAGRLQRAPDPAATDEAGRLLAAVQAASTPAAPPTTRPRGVEALLAKLGTTTGRTAAKFQAAAPRASPSDGSGLDLAAVAEGALSVARPPSAEPEQPAPKLDSPSEGDAASQYGPYQLLEKVAIGGMAEVFKAKRSGVEGFEKVVAVKRILPHLSDNKEFVDMFVDEAKMVAGLTHPNIVQIFDLGKIQKSYYIAMEFVHGRDLRSIQKRAKDRGLRIPLDLSLLIVSKVCSALEYAHRKKDDKGRPMMIVHRDISPQNILISFEGDVKLTDFGIAKAATKASTTDRGALRGKLLYMSPEQAWGKPIDRRSDIFSLGIVFYELITEEKAFLGNSEMNILEMVRECRVAPPSSLNPRVPDGLERVVMKALERDPEARYQDASEMYKDLERVLHERRPPAATELSRLLELLFDEAERGDHGATYERSGEPPAEGKALEVELDAAPPLGQPGSETDAAAVPREPLSVQQLLKRFGGR